jgi:SAM-dependent methyltransferase
MNNLTNLLKNITLTKSGVEIGGPSGTGRTIYENANSMDNVIFSKHTVWSNHTDTYRYFENKVGSVIINDATTITNIKDSAYDFIFASHTLEHIANPIKALFEWKRIIKKDGYIILILPEKSCCFDHNREVSLFSKLQKQYMDDVDEKDLSTLPEILKLHDLSMDLAAGTLEQFTARSLNNYENRCLHHYVYSPTLLQEMCDYVDCEFMFSLTDGLNIWFIMQK